MPYSKEIICQSLTWDTEFFGQKIGLVKCSSHTDHLLISTALDKFYHEDFDLIYVMLDGETMLDDALCKRYGGQIVDIKYILGLSIEPQFPIAKESEVLNYMGDGTDLYELVYAAGWCSRYKIDKHFSQEVFERFYRTWIVNSLNGKMADGVYVINDENGAPKGFATLKIAENDASIGLIAVDAAHRGEGIGKKLINHMIGVAQRRGCKRLTVATQKHNTGAVAFYKSCNMKLIENSSIYHFWLKDNS